MAVVAMGMRADWCIFFIFPGGTPRGNRAVWGVGDEAVGKTESVSVRIWEEEEGVEGFVRPTAGLWRCGCGCGCGWLIQMGMKAERSSWRLSVWPWRWWKTMLGRGLMAPSGKGGVIRRLLLLSLLLLSLVMYRSEIQTFASDASRGGGTTAALQEDVVGGGVLEAPAGVLVDGGGDGVVSRRRGEIDASAVKVVEGGNRSVVLTPLEWKDDATRYLMYFPLYGQLNNQVMSLINALVLAKTLGAVLVVPRVEAGFDSRFGSSSTRAGPFILGDYFDWDRIARVQGIIHMDEFLALPVAAKAARQGKLVVTSTFNSRTLAKEKSFYPYDLFFRPTERPREETDAQKREIEARLGINSPKVGKCRTWFDTIEEAAKMDIKTNGRVYLMSCMYQTITEEWGCQDDVPYWYEIRRHLVPRDEIRRTIAEWYDDNFEAPTLAVHLRLLFRDETILETTLYDVISSTLQAESNGTNSLASFRTIYLAYGNREMALLNSSNAIDYLKRKAPHAKIRACADMSNCASLGSSFSIFLGNPPNSTFLPFFVFLFFVSPLPLLFLFLSSLRF